MHFERENIFEVIFAKIQVIYISRPPSQNMRKEGRDESRRRIYVRRIPNIYTLNLK